MVGEKRKKNHGEKDEKGGWDEGRKGFWGEEGNGLEWGPESREQRNRLETEHGPS